MFWVARFHWLNLFAFWPWFWRWRSCTFLLPPGSRFCHGNPANCYLASGTAKHSQLFCYHGSFTCQTRPSCPLCHRDSSLQYCTSSVPTIPTPCTGRSVWYRWKTGSACARECDPPSHPCHAVTSQGMLLLAAFDFPPFPPPFPPCLFIYSFWAALLDFNQVTMAKATYATKEADIVNLVIRCWEDNSVPSSSARDVAKYCPPEGARFPPKMPSQLCCDWCLPTFPFPSSSCPCANAWNGNQISDTMHPQHLPTAPTHVL